MAAWAITICSRQHPLPATVAHPNVPSIRAGKPSHGEFDATAGKLAPGFDLGHVGRLGKPAKHFTRLCARLLARQRQGLAPERVAWPRTQRFRRAASDVGGTTAGAHGTPHSVV